LADEQWVITSPAPKTLTFSTAGRLQTNNDFVRFNQIQDVTIGGVRQVRNLGEALNQYDYNIIVPTSSLELSSVTASSTDILVPTSSLELSSVTASSTDILDFIGSSYANGAVNEFVWTDHDGTARTVRIVSENISITTLSNDHKLFSITLETVNS